MPTATPPPPATPPHPPTPPSPPPPLEPGSPPVLLLIGMRRKLQSAPMQRLQAALRARHASLTVHMLDEHVVRTTVPELWPVAHALLLLPAPALPLAPPRAYIARRAPLVINSLHAVEHLLADRWLTRRRLIQAAVPVPPALCAVRSRGDLVVQSADCPNRVAVWNADADSTFIIEKPFVEKPLDPDDHNVYIYYRDGGVRKLFRKKDNRSSVYVHSAAHVRQTGDFIYEKFYAPHHGTDIKVYAVAASYFHAEARKAPHIDGIVDRDAYGRERRTKTELTTLERGICSHVSRAFEHFIIGFDLLRLPNRQCFVIDVNGWSLVKNSDNYADVCAALLVDRVLVPCARARRPELVRPLALCAHQDVPCRLDPLDAADEVVPTDDDDELQVVPAYCDSSVFAAP